MEGRERLGMHMFTSTARCAGRERFIWRKGFQTCPGSREAKSFTGNSGEGASHLAVSCSSVICVLRCWWGDRQRGDTAPITGASPTRPSCEQGLCWLLLSAVINWGEKEGKEGEKELPASKSKMKKNSFKLQYLGAVQLVACGMMRSDLLAFLLWPCLGTGGEGEKFDMKSNSCWILLLSHANCHRAHGGGGGGVWHCLSLDTGLWRCPKNQDPAHSFGSTLLSWPGFVRESVSSRSCVFVFLTRYYCHVFSFPLFGKDSNLWRRWSVFLLNRIMLIFSEYKYRCCGLPQKVKSSAVVFQKLQNSTLLKLWVSIWR